MYKKKLIVGIGDFESSCYRPQCEDERIARPMSYYIKGGVDLDGVSERPPLPANYDSPDDIASGELDIATDPRVSRLDIVDFASYAATEVEKRAAADLSDTD